MITIIEGADGSGKSTLCKQLVERGYTLITMNSSENLDEWLQSLILFNNVNVIVDRSFITDVVYRLWDGKPRRGMSLNSMCTLLLQVKIIHCESGTEYDDSIQRGETLVTEKIHSDTIKAYYNIIMNLFDKFLDAKICKYNWHEDDINKVIKFIEEA